MGSTDKLVDRTNAHYSSRFSEALLDEMMFVGDAPADQATAALNEVAYDADGAQLAELRQLEEEGNSAAKEFFERANDRPGWYEADKIAHGQSLARAFSAPHLGISLTHSLFAGAIFARATLVTGSTGRLGSEPARRIRETTGYVASILEPGGLEPGSLGFESTIRVRLLHGSIRSWLSKSPGFSDSYVGVPIDQTMLAMTLGLFSYLNVRSLGRLGVALSDDDRIAHHHLWRYVGFLLGIDDRLLSETPAQEAELWSALVAHQAFPNLMGSSFMDQAIDAISASYDLSGWKRSMVRDLMLHLSGPAWFGLDDKPLPFSPGVLLVQAIGLTKGGARLLVPGAKAAMEKHGGRLLGAATKQASSHGYGVETQDDSPIDDNAMKRLSAGVAERFAHL